MAKHFSDGAGRPSWTQTRQGSGDPGSGDPGRASWTQTRQGSGDPGSTQVFLDALRVSRAGEPLPRRSGQARHLREEDRAALEELSVEEALQAVRERAGAQPEPVTDAVPRRAMRHARRVVDGPAEAPATPGVEEAQALPVEPAEVPAGSGVDEALALAVEPAEMLAGPGVEATRGQTPAAVEQAEVLAAEPPLDVEDPGQVLPTGTFLDPEAEAEASSSPSSPETGQGRDLEASVGRSSALMSVLVLVSRLTGFLRTWGQAYALGVTVVASCYTVANNLPNQLYELVVGGMLVTAFLPVYMSVKRQGGRDAANRYTSNLVSLVTLLMGLVALLGIVFAAQVVLTQSVGAQESFDSDLAALLFRFFAIEVVLYALSSVFSGVLNAERDYLWSMAAPIFNNFICTASFFGYAFLLDAHPVAALLVLALGNPLGVLVQVVMLVPSLRRHGIKIRPYVDLHDPALKETLSIGVPSIVIMVGTFVTVSVQSSCALAATASGAAVMYYARLWYTLPYAILAVPITTAMFTELSESFALGDHEGFKRGLASGSERILFFLVPFGLFLMAFSPELVAMLNSGSFTADEFSMTAQFICMLALALPLYGISSLLQKVCSALRRMTFFMWASVVGSVVQVLFCVAFTPIWGLNMVGLSTCAIYLVVDLATFWQLRRDLGPLGLRSVAGTAVRSLLLGVAGSVVGLAILWAASSLAGLRATGLASGIVLCVIAGIPALLVTYGGAMALKLPEARFLRSMVGRLARRAA